MGKPDSPNASTFECRTILDSIQNEFDQLQQEDNSLSQLHQDLTDLTAQRSVLVKRKGFNEKYCVLCCSAFNLLFKRKLPCEECRFFVCRSCCVWNHGSNHWICTVCEKQKLFHSVSREWICSRLKTNFGNFSAVKSLQNFCRNKRISDGENDSGYGASTDLPLMKILSSHSLSRDMRATDEEGEDEAAGDDEEWAEIHYSIETILEGLLGSTLDDALVDRLYPASGTYLNLFSTYHVKLVEVIQNLSKALQKALHNLPTENGITPTTAHAALKTVISALVDECQAIPPLKFEDQKEFDVDACLSFDFADILSSYDSLVAAAVINKIVEESQSRFKPNLTSTEEGFPLEGNSHVDYSVLNEDEEAAVLTPFHLPVECVQIEEIEEVTREFTDSEDDRMSSVSRQEGSSDFGLFGDGPGIGPAPFPEFGCDLPDEPADRLPSATWEENWLFRKKQRLPLYSNLRYQLLTYCDEPPTMFIPLPAESPEPDDCSSELSENHSAGSLEFSSEGEEPVFRSGPASPLPRQRNAAAAAPERPQPAPRRRDEPRPTIDNGNAIQKPSLETPPRPGTIAEREHQKWLNAVPLEHNPYSAENISKRSRRRLPPREHASSFEEFERRLSSSGDPHGGRVDCGPKDIDSELYKRDYYVNPCARETEEALPEEALNSFEEKVYVRSGKVFTLENRIRRLEQEINDPAGSPDHAKEKYRTLSELQQNRMNGTSVGASRAAPDEDSPRLHPEFHAATQFHPEPFQVFSDTKPPSGAPKSDQEKAKKSKPCRKVHSLTARSLSREFRDRLNPGRTAPAREPDRESPVLDSGGHGYTSDESTASSQSARRRPISRSILERATYWERRAEQGLLSDASVSEEFPGVDL